MYDTSHKVMLFFFDSSCEFDCHVSRNFYNTLGKLKYLAGVHPGRRTSLVVKANTEFENADAVTHF